MIVEIDGDTAKVDVAGTRTTANVSLVAGLVPGDYVIVHAGFAIEKIDAGKAAETVSLITEAAGRMGGEDGGGGDR